MKVFKWMVLSFIAASILAGGDYGGGPKIVALNKLDHSVHLGDIKLTKDNEKVELTVIYQRRVMKFDPFLGERDAHKLKYGKYAEARVKYDKGLFNQDLIDELSGRGPITIFRSKYRKLVNEYFTIDEVTDQVNIDSDKRYFEVNIK
ncbi:hypothetical protein M902_0806 [Bacteriovorax sp. BAL6_X]|uniref:hypothetical protein n=1 Tax=Bacteriovorax sp. BAL6_X TaxID=1201290 RepID=UPI000385C101|nr:hypothetical protein [Bacteriovorax sp. BAL6_X]EPZ49579.1 hypothetical protein M902_0806 [Bacteriovorax sp. BAL6_X]